jgi:Flp pilus assembly protein TadG
LIETALLLPLLLLIVFNAINFGYFFMVALNLSAASRSGTLYSIQGGATPPSTALPPVSSTEHTVSDITREDLNGALGSYSSTLVRVCSAAVGSTAGVPQCVSYSGTPTVTFSDPDADPEPDVFVLNRVDIAYQFQPIIKGRPFGIALLASPVCTVADDGTITCTFHRQVSMRAMN